MENESCSTPSQAQDPLACLDVYYREPDAFAAAVFFHDWPDHEPAEEVVYGSSDVAPYEPGSFYLRELPCLLGALQAARKTPRIIVVDGYVWLGPTQAGLGAHLYQALCGATPVIGVAKTRYGHDVPAHEVLRGKSARPLYVTAAGMDAAEAADCVARMHGPFRIPTLLRYVDALCRRFASEGRPKP